MFDALIFDCDGTLTDSMPLHFLAWRDALGEHGVVLTEERFYQLAGIPSYKIVGILAQEKGLSLDATAIAKHKERGFLDRIDELTEISGVTKLVRENHGKKRLAVASGGTRLVIERQLRHIHIHEYFETIVTAEDTERHKPEPDVFLEAARRLETSPERCCVYEDSDLGVEAARRAGMQYVDVRDLYRPRRVGE